MKRLRSFNAISICFLISLLLPNLARAQFNYTTNQGVVTITGYTGTNGIVIIPSTIVGLPVTSIASFAFYQKTILTNVTIPDSVTNIGGSAFFNCNRMTNVTMGANISTIGTSAFQGCSRLTNVVIPNSVANMGSGVFAGCGNLNSITMSSSLTAIADGLFTQCSSLTNIMIPNGVKSIGIQSFYKCLNLLNVEIPDAVTNIGSQGFASCSSLRSVTMGTNLTTIGSYAFQSCSILTNISLPNSVTSIGDYAFSFCTNLTHTSISTNTVTIGSYAFQGCVSLENVMIPASVTNIGTLAFTNCARLTGFSVAPNNPAYSSVAGVLFDHDQTLLIQYPLGNATEAYVVPNSVTNIGDGAFRGCIALTSITIPDGVSRFPNNVFRGCVGLTNVSIPESITIIPLGAFYGCSNLFGITIPNSVTNIGDWAFQGCFSLANVTIPDGVLRIPNNAFRDCASLTSISIPDRVIEVGNSAFLGCFSLTNATIGNSVTNIQASAFSGCFNLTSVSMGYIVYNIGNEAFRDCFSLATIYFYSDFPYNVSTNAFTNAPATAYYLPGATRWSTNLAGLPTAIWIPFTYATNNGGIIITGCNDRFLSAITISNTITGLPVVGIEEQAFDQCNKLVSITIPESVTDIGSHAFAGCTNLIDIYFEGNAPTADLPVFATSLNATVYYRPGATGWSSTFGGLPTTLWIKFDRWVHDGMVEIGVYSDFVSDVIIPRSLRGLPVTGIGLQAFRWSSITSVTIPEGVTYIGNGAFDACGQLTSVTLPKSITYVPWWGFSYCGSLTNITIPASVLTIVNYAFYGSGLRTVYFEGDAPGFQAGGADPKNAFYWCPVTAYYLPGTTGWTEFLSLVGIHGQLWDPHIQTSDGSFGMRTNQFGFNVTGTSNLAVVVEACTDLSNPAWTRLQTNTLTGAPFYFDDSQWKNYDRRFYRLRWP
jgi:hypothetical protein